MKPSYRETHPWLTFSFDINHLGPREWLSLGRAEADCARLTGTPLLPDVADRLERIYLSKGAHGTTAIEGNTLTEEQVSSIIEGRLWLPPSREYLATEVLNVLDAYRTIIRRAHHREESMALDPETIRRYNELVLRDLDVEQAVRPGEIRRHGVRVGRYVGPEAEDCAYLLDRLCYWLTCADFESRTCDRLSFARVLIKALLAHLYIAWIHPFGDGNGRTARLVEFHVLSTSGMVPAPAAHLLTDHYSTTRSRYYQVLDRSSRQRPFSPVEFVSYATSGFTDGLMEQWRWITSQHRMLTWESHVRSVMRPYDTVAGRRQRRLVLELRRDRPTPRSAVPLLTPELAVEYAGKTSKTVTRDINRLVSVGLAERTHDGILPVMDQIEGFLISPIRGERGEWASPHG